MACIRHAQTPDEAIWEPPRSAPKDVAEFEEPPHLMVNVRRHAADLIGGRLIG